LWPYNFRGKTCKSSWMPFAFGRQKRVLKLYSGEPAFMDILDQFDFSKHLCFANMGRHFRQKSRRHFRQPFTTYFMFLKTPPLSQILTFFTPNVWQAFLFCKKRERGNNPITQSLWTYHPSPHHNFFIFEFWIFHLSNRFSPRFSNTHFAHIYLYKR
jgi:hypothetical protein